MAAIINGKDAKPKWLRDDPAARGLGREARPRHRRRRRPGLHARRYRLVTYFIGSVASVLVALDARPAPKPRQDGVELSEDEVEALRSILKKADGS